MIETDEKVKKSIKIINIKDDKIMTLGQVAAYFKISEQIIINLVKEGEIPAFRIEDHWRIRKSDVNNFIEFLMKDMKLNHKTRIYQVKNARSYGVVQVK